MTPKERAAMQQALKAMKDASPYGLTFKEAIIACEEALSEQAEQEPFDMNDHPPHRLCECQKCMEYFTPLPGCDVYEHPVRTKDLTDEELNDIWYGNTKDGWLGLFRAVIAADREKNNV